MRAFAAALAAVALVSACSTGGSGAAPKPSLVADHELGAFTADDEGGTPVLITTGFRGAILTAITRWTLHHDAAEDCFSVRGKRSDGTPELQSAVPIWPGGSHAVATDDAYGVRVPGGRVIKDGQGFEATVGSVSDRQQTSLREALTGAGLPTSCAGAAQLVVLEPQ